VEKEKNLYANKKLEGQKEWPTKQPISVVPRKTSESLKKAMGKRGKKKTGEGRKGLLGFC